MSASEGGPSSHITSSGASKVTNVLSLSTVMVTTTPSGTPLYPPGEPSITDCLAAIEHLLQSHMPSAAALGSSSKLTCPYLKCTLLPMIRPACIQALYPLQLLRTDAFTAAVATIALNVSVWLPLLNPQL